ncbi:MAG: hypothetical protein OYG32_18160 [Rhodospirillaceae bacterium]|nr:hypothetical protein [Rhodospirillaceae bacterium]
MRAKGAAGAAAALAASLALAGCLSAIQGEERDRAAAEIARGGEEIGERLDGARRAAETGARYAGRPWYGDADRSLRPRPDDDPRGAPLPPHLEEPDAVSVSIAAAAPAGTAAQAIAAASGIPTLVDASLPREGGEGEQPEPRGGRAIAYEGRLSALLDRIAAEYDFFWSFDGRRIRLAAVGTRRWTVPLPAVSSQVSSSSGGLAGSASRSVSMSSSASQDPWAALERELLAATRPPASVSLIADASRVSVTGRPSDIRAAEAIVAEWTRLYSVRIGLEVAIYHLDADRAESFRAGLSVQPLPAPPPIAATLPAVVVPVPNEEGEITAKEIAEAEAANEQARIDAERETAQARIDAAAAAAALAPGRGVSATGGEASILAGYAAGHAFRLDFAALAEHGAVVAYRTASAMALSGTPAPIVLTSAKNYVSGVTRTEDGVSVETDSVDDGLSIHMLPRLIRGEEGERVQLSLTLMQNDLVGLDDFGAVQLPAVDQRMIASEVLMNPGETLVLSGYEQSSSRTGRSSGLLSTGREAGSGRVLLMVLVRPTLFSI